MRKIGVVSAFLAVLLAFAACKNPVDGGGVTPATPSAVAVTGVSLKESTSILVDHTEHLFAIVEPENATNQSVIWNSNNTSVAIVSTEGVVTGVVVTGV